MTGDLRKQVDAIRPALSFTVRVHPLPAVLLYLSVAISRAMQQKRPAARRARVRSFSYWPMRRSIG